MWTPSIDDDRGSRRNIDRAIGVLVGVRGCSEREAFDDIARAVHETGVAPTTLCAALVELASGASGSLPHSTEANHMWGHLFPARKVSADVNASGVIMSVLTTPDPGTETPKTLC